MFHWQLRWPRYLWFKIHDSVFSFWSPSPRADNKLKYFWASQQVLKRAGFHILLLCLVSFDIFQRLEKTLRQSRPRPSFYKWRNWGPHGGHLPPIREEADCRTQQESPGSASWVGDLSTVPHSLSSPPYHAFLKSLLTMSCFSSWQSDLVREQGDVCYEKQFYSSVLLWSYLGVGWWEWEGRNQVAWPAWLLCILMGSPLVTPPLCLPYPEGHIPVTKQSEKWKQ